MKRTFSIGLAFLLVLSTIGVTLNKHYSGGELYSIALFGEADSCCDVACDCCHDESETHQVKDEYVASSFELAKIIFIQTIHFIYSNMVEDLLGMDKKTAKIQRDKSPPPNFTGEEYTQNLLL